LSRSSKILPCQSRRDVQRRSALVDDLDPRSRAADVIHKDGYVLAVGEWSDFALTEDDAFLFVVETSSRCVDLIDFITAFQTVS